MKIFVGTLYSGENEYDECLASIKMQSYKNYQHFIFKNLPNKQAHHTLFKTFSDCANEYKILIKVDADMVLANNEVFRHMVDKLKANDRIEIFSIAVYDFFSAQLIWGLNAYRNSVRWNFGKETMFVDYPEVQRDQILKDDKELAPAALHCKDPSPSQAFHYGVHRGLKSLQPRLGTKHWELLEQTWKNYQRTKDDRIGFACLGAELAYKGVFRMSDLDYTNPKMKVILNKYLLFDTLQLNREIRKYRLLNWGILPGNLRRSILRYLQPELMFGNVPRIR